VAFLYTQINHEKSAEAKAWIETEVKEQEARYQQIVEEMDALNEQREQWYAEFLDRIQKRGFNMDGDQLIKIASEDIPVRPEGSHKVVY